MVYVNRLQVIWGENISVRRFCTEIFLLPPASQVIHVHPRRKSQGEQLVYSFFPQPFTRRPLNMNGLCTPVYSLQENAANKHVIRTCTRTVRPPFSFHKYKPLPTVSKVPTQEEASMAYRLAPTRGPAKSGGCDLGFKASSIPITHPLTKECTKE